MGNLAELITTLTIAVSQLILGIFIAVYTVENHHANFPVLSENAIWIDCVNYSHEPGYKVSLNLHIVEYCKSTIHPRGINQNSSVPIHNNVYFFQYIDHFHIPFSILIGTLVCVWSGIWHIIFALPMFISSIKIHQKWYWIEHVVPTGIMTISLIYFTGQHNFPLLMNYSVIMMLVTSFPTFYNKRRISTTVLFVLTYIYVLSNIIFYMITTINRSSGNLQWYLTAQFVLGVLVYSPFPNVFLLEKLLHIKYNKYYIEEEVCTPARYVHYVYSGIIRSAYIILIFSTFFTI